VINPRTPSQSLGRACGLSGFIAINRALLGLGCADDIVALWAVGPFVITGAGAKEYWKKSTITLKQNAEQTD